MALPDDAYMQLTPDLRICRVLNGMWQVSGAHGPIEAEAALSSMFAHQAAGFTTWDLADHYGPAEDFIGAFRRRLAAEGRQDVLAGLLAFTKWVPPPGPMTRSIVERAIGRSRARMGVETLDLLQFHWWDYDDSRYLDALHELQVLRGAGHVRYVALTNFDTSHLESITREGVDIVSNQVQYSLVDRRPEVRMAECCLQYNIGLLTYGTVCGGLLSERYLDQPEPSRATLNTASLQKYKQMIDAWGGWGLFQDLLRALKKVADKHRASIANVAVRAILDRPPVAGVIVGVRLGVSEHLVDNARMFEIKLDAEDWDGIDAISARAHDLYRLIGDCGDEYR